MYAPLCEVLRAVDTASETAISNVAQRFRAGDRAGYDVSARIAAKLLDLRLSAQALVETCAYPSGDSRAPEIGLSDSDVSAAGRYTPAEGYSHYLLLGFALKGGRCRFREAQDVMTAAMELDGAFLEGDRIRTEGTLRPRYLAQSGAHRGTMRRRGLIQVQTDKTDFLTPLGRAALESWLASRSRTIDDYRSIAPPVDSPKRRHRHRSRAANAARTQKSDTNK